MGAGLPPGSPPAFPPPSVPPVTLAAVNEVLMSLQAGEVTGETATVAVVSLSGMMDATAGGTSGQEVASALVAGVEMVGDALIAKKPIGAPPTEIASPSLQMSVAKKAVAEVASAPFKVPGNSAAQVVMPSGVADGVEAPDGVGTTLWSAAAQNPRGVDLGNATQGSPTLAFSLSVNGTELPVNGLANPIQLKLDLYSPIDKSTTCAAPHPLSQCHLPL